MKIQLPPIRIYTISKFTVEQLRYAKHFVPVLRTRKNKFGSDEIGHYHVVYCIINLTNSKYYFGKHTFNYDPKKIGCSVDYWGTSKHLRNSMIKFGMKNFRMLILKYFKTSEEAYRYEERLITLEMIKSKHCYNLKGGGKGFAVGEKHHIHFGVNPFSKRVDGTSVQTDRVKSGVHQGLKRLDGTSHASDRVEANTHHWLSENGYSETCTKRLLQQVKLGTHPLQNVPPWKHCNATEDTKKFWFYANKLYKVYLKNPKRGFKKNIEHLLLKYKIAISRQPIYNMLNRFKDGWRPNKDTDWILFSSTAWFTQK
jgi:hypothetical protein